MSETTYAGSGPYCYSHSMAMMMGAAAPDVAVIETLTGSPYGMQLTEEATPYFDPAGWTPEIGIDHALTALGWSTHRSGGGDEHGAHDRLLGALETGPVLVGPVEMGHLSYQPGKTGPLGADHYLVAIGHEGGHLVLHDPQGYPYARLPWAQFRDAWRADTVDYATPFTMRTRFVRERDVAPADALRASPPRALHWLRGDTAPPGALANHDAALALADLLSTRPEDVQEHLIHFAVRVGARRLADAAHCLRTVDLPEASRVLTRQARLVGALQHPLVTGDTATAARLLVDLAPTYEELRASIQL
ncbi:hypothetical protein [Actinoalloteichus caeruleus]|uniref:hypothetical protein n=1 Tax=Actinoalloteichus cyanogriseus TaxID=2893586 RepID=UPI0004AA0CE7|nr:hypothetical protein [Actinoalloteichus caeruleus]